MNKYIELLNLFVSYDTLRPQMTTPNIGEQYASATDAHSLVFFDKSLLPEATTFKSEGKYPDISFITDLQKTHYEVVDIARLKSLIEKCPTIEDTDEEEKVDTCDECNGSGEVTYIYEGAKYNDHELDGECPICEGVGKCTQIIETPNGKMIPNPKCYFKIENVHLSLMLINKLLEAQELIGGDIILSNYTLPTKVVLFYIGNVGVALMPILIHDGYSEYIDLGNII